MSESKGQSKPWLRSESARSSNPKPQSESSTFSNPECQSEPDKSSNPKELSEPPYISKPSRASASMNEWKPRSNSEPSGTSSPSAPSESLQKANLRSVVRGAYDLQKLRIQTGLRVVNNFKAKLGQSPGKTEDEELDADSKEILADLRHRYERITDGIVKMPKMKDFVGDELISEYTEFALVKAYFALEKQESEHFKMLGEILKGFRIFNEFLTKISGIGPAMAGVIISEIDITRARYASSIWAYAGLDVAGGWKIDRIEPISGDITSALMELIPTERPLADKYKAIHDDETYTISPDRMTLSVKYQWDDRPESCIVHYKFSHSGGRSRRKEHLVEREYIDKDGEPAKRVGITFNPFLKTKLIGVLGGGFLKVKESPYKVAYYNYKNRMENHAKYGIHNDKKKDENGRMITSKGRRHAMATRYAVKRFLVDLYVAWRTIEGLPVAKEYSEAKLGMIHAA